MLPTLRNPISVCADIVMWHNRWFEQLYDFAKTLDVTDIRRPECHIFTTWKGESSHRCGFYRPRGHICAYSLIAACCWSHDVRVTTAHEMCHAFQMPLMRGCGRFEWHDGLFKFLLHRVCRIPRAAEKADLDFDEVRTSREFIQRVGLPKWVYQEFNGVDSLRMVNL